MSKLLSRDISDKEAVQTMESLGCQVTYIEAPPPARSVSKHTYQTDMAKSSGCRFIGLAARIARVHCVCTLCVLSKNDCL